jgi:hypothetical protein
MANYYIHDQQLQIVDNAKYLGLTISKILSWNNHMSLASWRLCCRVGQLRSCSSVVTLALGS